MRVKAWFVVVAVGLAGLAMAQPKKPQTKEVVGTMLRVDTGDYVYCVVKSDAGKEVTLSASHKVDCNKVIGRRVRVRYSAHLQHVPEAGGNVEANVVESIEPVGQLIFDTYSFASQCGWSAFVNQGTFNWMKAHGDDKGEGYFLSLDYEVPSAELRSKATAGAEYLRAEGDNGNARAQAELSALDDALKVAIRQADSIADVKNSMLNCDDPRARPWSSQQQLWDAFSLVVKTMQQFASAPTRISPAALDAGAAKGGRGTRR